MKKNIVIHTEERIRIKAILGKYTYDDFLQKIVENFIDSGEDIKPMPLKPMTYSSNNRTVPLDFTPKIQQAIKKRIIPPPIGRSLRKIIMAEIQKMEQEQAS